MDSIVSDTTHSRDQAASSKPTEAEIETYSYGKCMWFALAAHDRTGWPLELLVDDGGYVAHSWVRSPNGKTFDVAGFGGADDFIVDAAAVRKVSRAELVELIRGEEPQEVEAAAAIVSRALGGDSVHDDTRTAPISQLLHVAEFKRIHLAAPFHLVVEVGERQSVTVTGDARAVQAVQARIAVRTLNLKLAPSAGEPAALPTLHITVPRLERVCVAGAGEVEVRLRKQASLDLVIDEKGSGTITVTSGEVIFLHAKVQGTGSIHAKDLVVGEGTLTNTGTGKIDATVTYSVTAKLKGAGEINVWGAPRVRELSPGDAGRISLL